MTTRIHHHCIEVMTGQDVRNAAVQYLKERMYDIGHSWKRALAPSSVTLTSPCGRKIVKIDSMKIVTVDSRIGTEWKTLRFTSKTIEEAWRTATQTVKAYDAQRNRDVVH